jgi:hypothetical protein
MPTFTNAIDQICHSPLRVALTDLIILLHVVSVVLLFARQFVELGPFLIGRILFNPGEQCMVQRRLIEELNGKGRRLTEVAEQRW